MVAKRGNVRKQCAICGKDFFIYPCKEKTAKYCSKLCETKSKSINLKGIYKKCVVCGKDFYARPKLKDTKKYCSVECYNHDPNRLPRGKTRNGITKICSVCQKEFYVPIYREKTAKYCSLECQNHKKWEHHKRICKGCGKKFEVSNSRSDQKFCSEECKSLIALSVKELRRRQRLASFKSRGGNGQTLRKYIFQIKYPRCEICDYDEFKFCLDIHHIDGNPDNRNLDNLMVLCSFCHKKIHKKIIYLNPRK